MEHRCTFLIPPLQIYASLRRRLRSQRTPQPWFSKVAWACLCAGLCFALPASAEELQIDLNRADVAELCRLPGIGPKRAEAIVKLRRKKPFTRISQLLQVRGIGHKTLKRLRPLLYIDALGQMQKASLHPLRHSARESSSSVPVPLPQQGANALVLPLESG